MGGIAFLSLMSLLICEWASPAFLGYVMEELILMKMWKKGRELSSFAWLVGGILGSLACFSDYLHNRPPDPPSDDESTTEFDEYQNYKWDVVIESSAGNTVRVYLADNQELIMKMNIMKIIQLHSLIKNKQQQQQKIQFRVRNCSQFILSLGWCNSVTTLHSFSLPVKEIYNIIQFISVECFCLTFQRNQKISCCIKQLFCGR